MKDKVYFHINKLVVCISIGHNMILMLFYIRLPRLEKSVEVEYEIHIQIHLWQTKSFQHFVLTASIISKISCFVLLYKVDDKEMSLFFR